MHILSNTPRYLLDNDYLSPDKLKFTRNSHKLNLVTFQPHTNLFKYSFFPLTIGKWNLLPGELRALPLEKISCNLNLLCCVDFCIIQSFLYLLLPAMSRLWETCTSSSLQSIDLRRKVLLHSMYTPTPAKDESGCSISKK